MIERYHWYTASMYTSRLVRRLAISGADYNKIVEGLRWELLRLVSEVNCDVSVCFNYTPEFVFGQKRPCDDSEKWLAVNDNFEVFVRYIETLRAELTMFKKSCGLVGFYTTANMLQRSIATGAFILGAVTEVYDNCYLVTNDRLPKLLAGDEMTMLPNGDGVVYVQGNALVLPEAAPWHLVDPDLIGDPIKLVRLPQHEIDAL